MSHATSQNVYKFTTPPFFNSHHSEITSQHGKNHNRKHFQGLEITQRIHTDTMKTHRQDDI